MPLLALMLIVCAQVDLPLSPATQFDAVNNIVTFDLRAEASTPQSVAAIDAILSWDPAELQFIGPVAGSYAWFIAGFLPDPDGINADVTDGSAIYTALAPPATPLVLPPNIVVASFKFKLLQEGTLTLLPSLGSFGKTRVVSTTPGVEITGVISGPVCAGPPGTWTPVGAGIPGTTGLPLLGGSGPQACNATITIALSSAMPGSVAYLPVGISFLGLPCKGGILVPNLDTIIIVVTSPTGDLTLNASWPSGLPSGFSIWYQYWLKDPGAIKGWQSSNGIRSTTG